jgi:hypothetical protein
MKKLEHGMLLDSKQVMDSVDWSRLKHLIPGKLYYEFQIAIEEIENDLAECDVADRYEEKA